MPFMSDIDHPRWLRDLGILLLLALLPIGAAIELIRQWVVGLKAGGTR